MSLLISLRGLSFDGGQGGDNDGLIERLLALRENAMLVRERLAAIARREHKRGVAGL